MIEAAAVTNGGPVQTVVISLASVLATLLGGYLVYRNARWANQIADRTGLSQQQLAWTQQAMTEATSAKAEAKEASTAAKAAGVAADAATARADAAEVKLRQVSDMADKLIDWIARVVRKAHADGIDDGASPAVQELLRVINGGPPEISTSRLKRSDPYD
jgi:transposase-like protein